MAIEELEDIIEMLADKLGIYGAHDDRCESGERVCRCCWISQMDLRIVEAMKIRNKLSQQ